MSRACCIRAPRVDSSALCLAGVSLVETRYLGGGGVLVRDPISVHELDQVGLSGVLEDLGYIVEGRRHVAELVVGAIA